MALDLCGPLSSHTRHSLTYCQLPEPSTHTVSAIFYCLKNTYLSRYGSRTLSACTSSSTSDRNCSCVYYLQISCSSSTDIFQGSRNTRTSESSACLSCSLHTGAELTSTLNAAPTPRSTPPRNCSSATPSYHTCTPPGTLIFYARLKLAHT